MLSHLLLELGLGPLVGRRENSKNFQSLETVKQMTIGIMPLKDILSVSEFPLEVVRS